MHVNDEEYIIDDEEIVGADFPDLDDEQKKEYLTDWDDEEETKNK